MLVPHPALLAEILEGVIRNRIAAFNQWCHVGPDLNQLLLCPWIRIQKSKILTFQKNYFVKKVVRSRFFDLKLYAYLFYFWSNPQGPQGGYLERCRCLVLCSTFSLSFLIFHTKAFGRCLGLKLLNISGVFIFLLTNFKISKKNREKLEKARFRQKTKILWKSHLTIFFFTFLMLSDSSLNTNPGQKGANLQHRLICCEFCSVVRRRRNEGRWMGGIECNPSSLIYKSVTYVYFNLKH